MKLLQPAKFFAGGTTDYDARALRGNVGIYGASQAAHVQHGDLVLMSRLPESAAEAEKINEQVAAFIALHNERELAVIKSPKLRDYVRHRRAP